jgi:hypothetical protein
MAIYTFAGKIRALLRVIVFLRSVRWKLIFKVIYREVGNLCNASFLCARRVVLHCELGSTERLESILLYAVCCERTPKSSCGPLSP